MMNYSIACPPSIRRIATVILVVLFACGQPATGRPELSPISIKGPIQVIVGAPVEIEWSGNTSGKDFVSIDQVGAPEKSYGKYIYAKSDTSGTLRAPDQPGHYLIRYHSETRGYPVRGSAPLEVVDTRATIKGPLTVDSNSHVMVEWTGPGHRQDFISIDPVGSEDRKYGPYAYAKKNPAKIRGPEAPGSYLVRYHLAQSYRVIGQTELTVLGVSATLTAPAQVKAGGVLSVEWTGPDGPGDYISIDPANSSDREYLQYRYTRDGSPAGILIPEEAGKYEIRYHQGQKRTVLAVTGLEVFANSATVAGPASVAGGSKFAVRWSGPENSGDYITIVPRDAPARDYQSYHYTKRGSLGSLEAPLEPGAYELRYMTGRTRGILARADIEVTPGAVPGMLRVFARSEQTAAESIGAVEVILDASGSMLKRLDGERRIEIAKKALGDLVREVLPAGTPFALRVFGHLAADSCRTDLEIPVAPLDANAVTEKIRTLAAKNLAKTPIAASLSKVRQDLSGISGPVTVVLLTDGEETCGGDPGAAIKSLRGSGFDVRVNIVGFAINEIALEEKFQDWARIGNGRYIEAHNKQQLREAMVKALDVPFEVLLGDEVVATGVVNGGKIAVLPGKYRVRVLGSKPRDLGEVVIEARAEVGLSVE